MAPPLARRVVSVRPSDRTQQIGFVVASAVIVGAAFVGSRGVVAGLEWPHDLDLLRNIASGVAFRDGHLFGDPHYSGVPAWYSPLTSALLAAVSLVTSLPINRLGTQGGVFLNLLTPIVLAWVTARWFGRRAALGTLVAFLFVMGLGYPAYAVVEYTPYLLVPFYALGLFLLALAALPAAVNRGSKRDALVLGIAVGMLALAHPGAVMILLAIVAVQFVRAGLHASRPIRIRLARSAGIAAATGLVLSAPFWLPVVVRYQGQVANHAPSSSVWLPLHRNNLWRYLREFLWRWPMLVIAVGLPLWVALRLRRDRPSTAPGTCDGASIVATWTVLALVALPLVSYRPEWFPLPSYHFLYYLSAVLSIWFGISVAAIVEAVLGHRNRRWGALATAIVVAGIAIWPFLRWHTAVIGSRDDALRFRDRFNDLAAVDWIRAHTDSQDVFLNAGRAGFLNDGLFIQFFAGLAGRYSVSIDSPEFSSPWVDWNERHQDSRAMVRALESCKLERFENLATQYGRVRYVLVPARSNVDDVVGRVCRDAVPIVYRDYSVVIRRVDRPGDGADTGET